LFSLDIPHEKYFLSRFIIPSLVFNVSKVPIRKRPFASILFEASTRRISVGGNPCILLPVEALLYIVKALEKEMPEACDVLELIGESFGRSDARQMSQTNFEEKIGHIREVYSSGSRWGFGVYKLISMRPEKPIEIVFQVENDPFYLQAEKDKAALKFGLHSFFVGFYSEYFSEIFGRRLICRHPKCKCKGDPVCEFRIEEPSP